MEKHEIKKLARELYQELKGNNIEKFIEKLLKSLEKERTGKLKMAKTPVMNAIGKELGILMMKDNDKFDKLLKLWKISFRDAKKGEFATTTGRELRYIVINALGSISKKEYENSKKFVLGILGDLRDWEMVDTLGLRVIVNLAKSNKEEIFSTLEKWTSHKNKWVRRLSVASLPPIIRSMPNEAENCLKIIEKLMNEQDIDVKKAVAWALREISKRDPNAVYKFLTGYLDTINKDTLWIIREGMKKLPSEFQKKLHAT
ncbi:MAG: DNA alkylation repair protein [Candidatus Njordarchaeia archaeon]|nr:DNA alkylation repair protein [Candidatus Korarchaeota archaeon]